MTSKTGGASSTTNKGISMSQDTSYRVGISGAAAAGQFSSALPLFCDGEYTQNKGVRETDKCLEIKKMVENPVIVHVFFLS